jgi:exopolysaccharide biosynthesis predicted pyruvyltransferase EpsI
MAQVPLTHCFPQLLQQALAPLGQPRQCALLNYPNHVNIGDHMIWAGTVDYLQRVNQTRIAYTGAPDSYSERSLNLALSPADPILLHGGGSLGDLWPDRQEFHERVVAGNPNRPVIVLPQSMHFRDAGRARRAADIFNAHGGLTLFMREQCSYARACELFTNCRVHLAPDMAFQLAGFFDSARPAAATTLLLSRRDHEALPGSERMAGIDHAHQDWVSFERKWRWGRHSIPLSRTLARWYREGWQRRFLAPGEYRLRAAWLDDLRADPATSALAAGPGCGFSLGLIWDGCHQLRSHRALVTDRLHAHLLATMLGMPSLLRPNSYDKNKSFHETWLSDIPWCRFVADDAAVPQALAEVIAASSRTPHVQNR